MPVPDSELERAPVACPVCKSTLFASSGQTVELPLVLKRWEEALGCVFPDEVKAYYADPGREVSALTTCYKCGFEQFFPTITGTAGFYDVIEAGDYYNTEKWEFRLALKIISNLSVASVLDIGCGSGAFLDQLRIDMPTVRRNGHELNSLLRPGLESQGHHVIDVPLAAMAPSNFDVITAFQVLEHVATPAEMLLEVFKLLRPGGFVFITTPNQAGPIQNFSNSLTEIPPHHVTRWTPRALRLAIEQSGFIDSEIWYEPLASGLWDAYLPVVMDDNCWAQKMFGCFVDHLGEAERASYLHRELKRTGITNLYGHLGQSIMVMARKPGEQLCHAK